MKVSDKLAKVQETISVHLYDNGFLFELAGVDANEDWKTSKILCDSLDEVFELITEASKMKRS